MAFPTLSQPFRQGQQHPEVQPKQRGRCAVMTTDKDLLEKAAKAAGIHFVWMQDVGMVINPDSNKFVVWNPLTDDGDAFRLVVKLRLDIAGHLSRANLRYVRVDDRTFAELDTDHCAATRRAIVRAAAAIGETT